MFHGTELKTFNANPLLYSHWDTSMITSKFTINMPQSLRTSNCTTSKLEKTCIRLCRVSIGFNNNTQTDGETTTLFPSSPSTTQSYLYASVPLYLYWTPSPLTCNSKQPRERQWLSLFQLNGNAVVAAATATGTLCSHGEEEEEEETGIYYWHQTLILHRHRFCSNVMCNLS